MFMIKNILKAQNISKNIWKIKADSNVYFLNFNGGILIDTGRRLNRLIVKKEISELINPEKIKKVIFTHLHFDHIGNFDLFKNAEFFASKQEINDFNKNKLYAVLNPFIIKKFKVKLKPLVRLKDFEIISTPGHTKGSICFFYKKEKILFSGDTLFFDGLTGRTDLPTSAPEKMKESLEKLEKINYKILCPGHEYF